MGLLDFAEEGAAKQLTEKVTKLLASKVEGLKVKVEEGEVTLWGTVADEDAKQDVIALVKKVDGVKKIKTGLKLADALPEVENAAKNDKGDTVYTVQAGDTLWGISEKFYGNGSKYMKIFEANREVWKDYNYDPNYLYVNWKLVIPPKED